MIYIRLRRSLSEEPYFQGETTCYLLAEFGCFPTFVCFDVFCLLNFLHLLFSNIYVNSNTMLISIKSGPLNRPAGGLGKGAAFFTAFNAAISRLRSLACFTIVNDDTMPSVVTRNRTLTLPSICFNLAESGYFLWLSILSLSISK